MLNQKVRRGPAGPPVAGLAVPPRVRHAGLAATVGNTPVVWIDAPFTGDDRGFWAKLEGHNPGGMKDRPALHMVAAARARADLSPGGRIIESTSGHPRSGSGVGRAGVRASGHPGHRPGAPCSRPALTRAASMKPSMRESSADCTPSR